MQRGVSGFALTFTAAQLVAGVHVTGPRGTGVTPVPAHEGLAVAPSRLGVTGAIQAARGIAAALFTPLRGGEGVSG